MKKISLGRIDWDKDNNNDNMNQIDLDRSCSINGKCRVEEGKDMVWMGME